MPDNPKGSRDTPGTRFGALRELTVSRVKEFLREPQLIFWVFLFPVLLAIVLGFAFREKSAGPHSDRSRLQPALRAGNHCAVALARLLPKTYAEDEGRDALRAGKISLLVGVGPSVIFYLDEIRPDSRIARIARIAAARGCAPLEGANGLVNLVTMPMWLLSGVFFSIERFPDVIQPLIHVLPLTALNEALRGIMNEG